jgi:GxxExxY protein
MSKLLYKELSNEVLGAAFTVHSTLGSGLLESLYKKAMCIELKYRNINYECESPYEVFYRNKCSTSLSFNNYIIKVIYWNL